MQPKTRVIGKLEGTTCPVQSRYRNRAEERTNKLHTLEHMVKRFLDQLTKDRNFDARNDRAANAATTRRKSEDRGKKAKDERHKIADHGWQKENDPKKSFKHDMSKNGKGKGKRDRPSSLSPEPRSAKAVKMEKDSCFVYKLSERKLNETVIQLWASSRMCQKQGGRLQILGRCAFLHPDTEGSRQRTRSLGCESQDVGLPEPRVGLTNETRSFPEEKWSKISESTC